MMDAPTFAREWIAAWNRRDLTAVLGHYLDTVELTSPRALELVPETHGRVAGKAALGRYWQRSLEQSPDLAFTLREVYQGIDRVALTYDNHRGEQIVEYLQFVGDKIAEAHIMRLAI